MPRETKQQQIERLKAQLAEAQETLRAIQAGEVDALIINKPEGQQIYTLEGAEKPHRLLVEAMNEGAMTLNPDGTVLYCNARLAEMARKPMENIIGSSWRELFPDNEHLSFRFLLERAKQNGVQDEHSLMTAVGKCLPVQVSVATMNLLGTDVFAVLLTDVSGRKAAEEALRQSNEKLESRVQERTEQLQAELTERKRAEEGLRKERERAAFLARMLEESSQAFGYGYPDGRIKGVNHAFAALLGCSREEVEAKNWIDLTPPEWLDPEAKVLETLHRTGQPQLYEKEYIRKNGSRVQVEMKVHLVRNERGEPEHYYAFITDISERKRAEATLRASEQRFRSLFDHSPDAVLMTTPDDRIKAANPAACAMFGMSEAEICQVGRAELVDTTDPRHQKHLEDRRRTGKIVNREATFIRKDGTKFPGEVTSVVLTGEQQLSFVLLRDISGRKRAEEALQKNEAAARERAEELSAIMDALPSLTFIAHDRECRRMSSSRPACELLRLPHGANTSMTAPPEERPQTFRAIKDGRELRPEELPVQRAAATGQPVRDYELTLAFNDGTSRVIYGSAVPLLDAQGQSRGAVGSYLDITDLKQAEEALKKAKEELARANAALEHKVHERTAKLNEMVGELEHFSYTITHDMRAPLRAMHGLSKMLMSECAECEHGERRDFLRRIGDAATRMDSLITDSLNYNKAVREELALEPVDVRKLLESMVESYPQFQPHKAEIKIDGDIPLVLGNIPGLTQCISNLLENAVKFVDPDKVPNIHIWAETQGDFVRLFFRDNGVGIPKQYQEQIWDMFQRLSRDYEGTGIGLALVKKVMQRMGGRVGVESEPGQGSCFWLDLKRYA